MEHLPSHWVNRWQVWNEFDPFRHFVDELAHLLGSVGSVCIVLSSPCWFAGSSLSSPESSALLASLPPAWLPASVSAPPTCSPVFNSPMILFIFIQHFSPKILTDCQSCCRVCLWTHSPSRLLFWSACCSDSSTCLDLFGLLLLPISRQLACCFD